MLSFNMHFTTKKWMTVKESVNLFGRKFSKSDDPKSLVKYA